ncbi:MAG TPA: hypothetical protein VFY30_06990 [Solirubrobacterales bacterium]|nr:hypothetical protein [Solirubrobacterales bacterium]
MSMGDFSMRVSNAAAFLPSPLRSASHLRRPAPSTAPGSSFVPSSSAAWPVPLRLIVVAMPCMWVGPPAIRTSASSASPGSSLLTARTFALPVPSAIASAISLVLPYMDS